MARAWYAYNNIDDPFLPTSYFYSAQKPNCLNGFATCAIYAVGVSPSPNPLTLSTNIRYYIANGLVTGLAQPWGPYKKHVYMKPTS